MEKVFIGVGNCPHGQQCKVDSPQCRQCSWYIRPGVVGAMYVLCCHPVEERAKEKTERKRVVHVLTATRDIVAKKQRAKRKAKSTAKPETGKRKRGRPKKNA